MQVLSSLDCSMLLHPFRCNNKRSFVCVEFVFDYVLLCFHFFKVMMMQAKDKGEREVLYMIMSNARSP